MDAIPNRITSKTQEEAAGYDKDMVAAIVRQFSAAEGEQTESDIKEKTASARVAVQEVAKAFASKVPMDDAFVEAAAEEVYNAWLARNPHKVDNPEHGEGDTYANLSEEWKEKDRVYVRAAIQFWKSGVERNYKIDS